MVLCVLAAVSVVAVLCSEYKHKCLLHFIKWMVPLSFFLKRKTMSHFSYKLCELFTARLWDAADSLLQWHKDAQCLPSDFRGIPQGGVDL